MHFQGAPFLPEPAAFGRYLIDLRYYLERTRRLPVEEVLAAFLGFPVAPRAFHLRGLHHVAAYIGDYRREDEVERWLDFLSRAEGVAELRSGPSWIAPRFYGAPGYWISCRLDGVYTELFTVKHLAPWAGHEHAWKASRMSHFALLVDGASHVRPLLDWFAHYPGLAVLAFSQRDELGHTYGHLLHGDRVLELVHEEEPPATGQPASEGGSAGSLPRPGNPGTDAA